jgi:oligogalacturonide lyase
MQTRRLLTAVAVALGAALSFTATASAQMGKRFPSEKKTINDPITGEPLTFLTSSPAADSKLYQTHQCWTIDGKWIVFRSTRDQGPQAYAVNEDTGDIVQLTEGEGNNFGSGAINLSWKSNHLFYSRVVDNRLCIFELDLGKLLADSQANAVKSKETYERLCGKLGEGFTLSGGFGLDANEDWVYIGCKGGDTGSHLPPGTKIEPNFGPRQPPLGAGPSGLRAMNVKTGEVKVVIDMPFQCGHVQANPFNPGEIIYCWETGGKARTRAWVVNADGSDNRPIYDELPTDWITHEAVIGKDEVALAIMGHQRIGGNSGWGPNGTRQYATGLAVVNLRTKAMRIEAQTDSGSGLWHVNGSYDGRWLVGDDFSRSIYLIDRKTHEMIMLSTGHKETAADHPHPIFNRDGTKILIQSAMITPEGSGGNMDLCLMPVPKTWLNRTYSPKVPQ